MPTVPCMGTSTVPCLGTSTVPCLGTFASARPRHVCSPYLGLAGSLPGNTCQFPAWERLPVCMPCLGMLAVPAWDACQFPALERLPVPCLGTFCSSSLGRFASSLPGNVCQCPAWACLPVPYLGTPFAGTPSLAELFSYAYRTCMRGELLRLFKPEMPRTPVPCYFVSAMNIK